jgi:hypothetical protein
MRKVGLVVGVLLAMASIGLGTAQARLDPSYGVGGVVPVKPEQPAGWRNIGISGLTPGRGGNAFAVGVQAKCAGPNFTGCETSYVLHHYFAGGELDLGYGGGLGYRIPNGHYALPLVGVDASGRPLLAAPTEPPPGSVTRTFTVTRLAKTGEPDPGFGQAGTTTIECAYDCGILALLGAPDGSIRVVSATYPAGPSTLYVSDLDPSGRLVDSFGSHGTATFALPDRAEAHFIALTPGGGIYFGGGPAANNSHGNYLLRISAKGRLDRRFDAAAAKAVRAADRINGGITSIVVGGKGQVELFGYRGTKYVGGFELRLKPDGFRDPSFGNRGLRKLPYSIHAATLGTEGATMALSEGGTGWALGLRILADGRLDQKFGGQGVPLPGSLSESSLKIARGPRGAVTVADEDLHFCRSSCPQEPKLYRLLEK